MSEITPVKLCECGCGQPTAIPVKTNRKMGRVKGQPMRFVHGHNARGSYYVHHGPVKHGLSDHPLYSTWRNMLSRCYNEADPSYRNWGARGIQVCAEWRDVRIFVAWMEQNLGSRPEGRTLDRIDNDRGYEPGNVRWATPAMQRANQRRLGRTINGLTQDARKNLASRLRREGLTQQAIGRVLGISQVSVSRYLKGGG